MPTPAESKRPRRVVATLRKDSPDAEPTCEVKAGGLTLHGKEAFDRVRRIALGRTLRHVGPIGRVSPTTQRGLGTRRLSPGTPRARAVVRASSAGRRLGGQLRGSRART